MSPRRRWEVKSEVGSRLLSKGTGPGRPAGSAAARRHRRYEQHDRLTVQLEVDGCSWRAIYDVVASDRRPVIASVRIEPVPQEPADPLSDVPPPTLSPADHRALIVPAMALAEARAALPQLSPERRDLHGVSDLSGSRPTRQQQRCFHAHVAELYAERCANRSPTPIPDVVGRLEAETRCAYSAIYVRDVISGARDRGWLTPAPGRGRAGGELTELARRVLDGSNGP